MSSRIVALSSLALAVLLAASAGCRQKVRIPSNRLAQVTQYDGEESIEYHGDDKRVDISPERDPDLRIEWRGECDPPPNWPFKLCLAGARLEEAHVNRGKIQLEDARRLDRSFLFPAKRKQTSFGQQRVESATLVLKRKRPDFRPSWAIGGMVGGPGIYLSLFGEYFPARWLSFDVGGAVTAPLGSAFAGAKFRPIGLGPIRPFAGASATFALLGESEQGPGTLFAWSPRVGLDIELNGRRTLLRLEGNLLRHIDGERALGLADSDWAPWGGVSLAAVF